MAATFSVAWQLLQRPVDALWWFLVSLALLSMELCARFLGTIGMVAAAALVYEGCGSHHGTLCQLPGQTTTISFLGVYIGDDTQMTGLGILVFVLAASWLPLGWSAADLVLGAALAPTLFLWSLPGLQGNCNGYLGERGQDESLLGRLTLSRSMGALVALAYPALLLLNIRGGAGAWPSSGTPHVNPAWLARLRGSIVAADVLFWAWLVAAASARDHPDWTRPALSPLQIDAGLFGLFLAAAATHTATQCYLRPSRMSAACAACIAAAAAVTLATLLAGGFVGPVSSVSSVNSVRSVSFVRPPAASASLAPPAAPPPLPPAPAMSPLPSLHLAPPPPPVLFSPPPVPCWGSWDGERVMPFNEEQPSSLGTDIPSCAAGWRPSGGELPPHPFPLGEDPILWELVLPSHSREAAEGRDAEGGGGEGMGGGGEGRSGTEVGMSRRQQRLGGGAGVDAGVSAGGAVTQAESDMVAVNGYTVNGVAVNQTEAGRSAANVVVVNEEEAGGAAVIRAAVNPTGSGEAAVNRAVVNETRAGGAAVNRAAVNQTGSGGAGASAGDGTFIADSRLLWALQRMGLTAVFFFSWVHSVSATPPPAGIFHPSALVSSPTARI